MVTTIPKSTKPKPSKRFEFTLEGNDTVFHLPLLRDLKPGLALRLSAEPESALLKLFEAYCPDALDAIEDNEQLDALFGAWKRESGIDLGESSASAVS